MDRWTVWLLLSQINNLALVVDDLVRKQQLCRPPAEAHIPNLLVLVLGPSGILT